MLKFLHFTILLPNTTSNSPLFTYFTKSIIFVVFNNEVIFLRKIQDGGASKSYGIHVAQMAGIPASVILRSKIILEEFMKNKNVINTKLDDKFTKKINQLPLFHDNVELVNEIKAIEINKLSPMDALNKIFEIKKKYDL